MAEKRDYYEVLGIAKGSGDDEIKKAFRKKAKEYHPDLNPNDKTAEAKFKEVNEAYEVLSDSSKKARYDQFGHAGVDPSYGGGGGGGYYSGGAGGFGFDDIGDIFDTFFGGGFSGGGRVRNPNAPIRGNNIDIGISLTFMEAAKGCTKEISVTRLERCESCSGSGAEKGTEPEKCPSCGGQGQVRAQQRTPFGVVSTTRPCDVCRGKGKIIKTPCKKCAGNGRIRATRNLSVTIPAGLDDRQTFVMRGQGDHGVNSGPAGDLNATVSLKPDPLFKRDGFDVLCEVPITFAQAVLGDEITVPTIDGKVKYTISEGTQSGTTFRLRSKGIPYVNSRGRGDQYVTVHVEVPKNLTGKQKDALKDFEQMTTDKNYDQSRSFFEKLKDFVSGAN